MSKFNFHQRPCYMKFSYDEQSAKEQAIVSTKKYGKEITTYNCPFCHKWHLKKKHKEIGSYY